MRSIILGILGVIFLLGFKHSTINKDAPTTAAQLGKILFEDPILSSDRSISCQSCHIPEFAFADTTALSEGVGGKRGTRNTPSVMNMAFRPYFFYDGRAATLAQQVKVPIENPVEMNLPYAQAIDRVQEEEKYQLYF